MSLLATPRDGAPGVGGVAQPAAPLQLLHITNHAQPVALPTGGASAPYAVRTQRVASLAPMADDGAVCDLLLIDWSGPLTDETLASVRALCRGRACVLIADADEDAAQGALEHAQVGEWMPRSEATAFWLGRTLRRLDTQSAARATAVAAGQAAHMLALLNRAPVFVAEVRADMTIAWSTGRLGAGPVSDLSGRRLGELTHPAGGVEALVHEALARGAVVEAELELAVEGAPFLCSAQPIDRTGDEGASALLTAWSVSRYKAMEDALRLREAQFHIVLEHTPMILARFDADLRYQWVHSGLPDFPVERLVGKLMGEAAPSAAADRLRTRAEEVLRSGKGARMMNNGVLPTGERVVYDVSMQPTRDDAGRVVGVTMAALDVTASHHLSEALVASERRYRTLVQSTSVGVFQLDAALGKVLSPAPVWEHFSGQKWPEYVDNRWITCAAPDDRAALEETLARARQEESAQRAEVRFLEHTTGVYRWCEVRIVPVPADSSQNREWVCALRDIDDRRQAEQKLALHAEELEVLLDILPVSVFFAHDARAEVITGNRMASAMMRMDEGANVSLRAQGDARPLHFHGRMHGLRVEPDELPVQRAVRNGVELNDVELEYVYDDGTVISLFGAAKPLFDGEGRVRGGVGAFVDITERQQLLRRLATSEARFSAFMDNLPALAYMKDAQGRYLFANRAATASMNIPAAQLLGKTDSELNPGQDAEAWMANDRAVFAANRSQQYSESAQRADGLHHMLSVKFPMVTPDGEVCIGGVSFDVTQQQQLEAALTVSEERLRLAVSGGALGMWDWAGDNLLVLNRRLCTFLDIEPVGEETPIALTSLKPRLHPDDVQEFIDKVGDLIAQGDGEFRREVRVQTPVGESRWILMVGQLHSTAKGARMLGVAIDITEIKRAEEVVRRVQDELALRVEVRTRQLAVANKLLLREVDERRQAELQLEEIRRLLGRSREAERMRLAHELHDGPMQELATLGFELARAGRALGDHPLAAEIISLRERVRDVNLVLRNFAGDLRPPLLDSFGLIAALEGLLEQVQQRSPELHVHADLPATLDTVDDDIALALYRFCQQALHNIQRHANATEVHVVLTCTPDHIELTVEDNGEGFVVPSSWVEFARSGHMGVVGMEERLRAVGGVLQVQSQPGQGTTFSATVPCANPASM